jgi:hypothetical protein
MWAKNAVFLASFVALLGCGSTVHPQAEEIHVKALDWGSNSEKLTSVLMRRGFREYTSEYGMGGHDRCIEKARGGALWGVDVVRFCTSEDGQFRVNHFNTHGIAFECFAFDPEGGTTQKCDAHR